jgi:glucose/arabinose dehydrogenase
VAAAGATEPPQQELVQSWCQQFNSHSMGDLEFDSTGALLVSGGEGANYSAADYGQFENPCGDPLNEGGSLRAQDVQTPEPHDRTDYSGSIIRIDPATGEALPTNPLYKDPANAAELNPDVRARRTLAYGFRNPFRFEIRPGTSEVYVGDVGQNDWEELDRLASPPVDATAFNFGWPCYEGANGFNHVAPTWKALAEAEPSKAPLCQNLYNSPALVTAPLWAYGHSNGNPPPAGLLFTGDECDPSPGAAFSGLAFYEPTGIPAGAVYPAQYQGALFMADAARGCIWTMAAGTEGRPDPTKIANFATSDENGAISPVDIVQGPGGALYAPNFYDDSIEQIRYVGNNQPPTATIKASKVGGEIGAGFEVVFDAGESSDPEGDTIHYAWDLDGDGQFDDGSDQPTAERTYNEAKNVVVKVRVSDDMERSDIAEVTIYPGDEGPPEPTIELPSPSLDWAVGDMITYKGSAIEPDGDTLANGRLHLKWNITIRHCPGACHTHPYIEPEGAGGSFPAPPHEYPSHLRFELTATDNRGRSVTTDPLDILPRVVEIGLNSEPPGIPLSLDGEVASATPFELIAGSTASVLAPPTATIDGIPYGFSSWSDGGMASHQITSLQSTNLIARYTPQVSPPPPPEKQNSTVRVTVASRPPGIKLRAGKLRERSPFTLEIPKESALTLRAPRHVTHGRRTLHLRGWRLKGKLKPSPTLRVVGRSDGRYLAVFGR